MTGGNRNTGLETVEKFAGEGAKVFMRGSSDGSTAKGAHPKADHWLRHYVGTLTNVRPPDSVKYYHQ